MSGKGKLKNQQEALLFLKEKFVEVSQKPGIDGYVPYIDPASDQSPQKDFHSSSARGRLFIGGNRSGKTVGGAAETVMRATGRHKYLDIPKPPVRLRAVGVDFTNGIEKIIKPEIAKWVPPSFLINGSWEDSYSKEFRTLTLNNGSFIEFMSYDQDTDKFAGTSRHGIWFDEEPPESIFDECMQRLVDTAGDWWMTMTPVEGMTWVFDEIYEPGISGQDTSIFVIEVNTGQNPYIDMEAREELLQSLTDEEKKARTEGKFISLGGLIYPQFNPKKHIIDPFTPTRDNLWVGSLDHGYNNPTAWLWAAVDGDGQVFVFDELYESGRIIRELAEEVHRRNARNKRIPDYYVGDTSIKNTSPITRTSIHTEYAEAGIPIVLSDGSPGSVAAGLNRVARYLQGVNDVPKLYITSNCEKLIWEISRYRWANWANKKDEKKKNKKEEPHKKNDHACDSLRYLISSRPEKHDDGTYRPIPSVGGVSASGPYDAENLVDLDLVSPVSRNLEYADTVDAHMGGEW